MTERTGLVFAKTEKETEELSHLLYDMKEKGVELLSIIQFKREYDVLAELFHAGQMNEIDVILRSPTYPIFEAGDIAIYIKDTSGIDISDHDMPIYLFGEEDAKETYYINAVLYEKAGFFASEKDCYYMTLYELNRMSS